MEPTTLIIAAIILAAVAFFVIKGKRGKKTKANALPPSHVNPKPNPGAPDPTKPNPPPDSPEVLIDRNGKWPYDTGYDPRVDRPKEEFSPVEPQGAYYNEGPFDPNGRWVGPDGVHWTDKHGVHHGP